MAKVTVYRRVYKPVYERLVVEQADLLKPVRAADEAGRTVQDVSMALRTRRVDGYFFMPGEEGEEVGEDQQVYILRSDIPKLEFVGKGARKRARST